MSMILKVLLFPKIDEESVSMHEKNGLKVLFSDHASTRELLRVIENRKKKFDHFLYV